MAEMRLGGGRATSSSAAKRATIASVASGSHYGLPIAIDAEKTPDHSPRERRKPEDGGSYSNNMQRKNLAVLTFLAVFFTALGLVPTQAGAASRSNAEAKRALVKIMPRDDTILAPIRSVVDPNWEASIGQYNAGIPAVVKPNGPRVGRVNMPDARPTADLSDVVRPSDVGYDTKARTREPAILTVLSGSGHTTENTTAGTSDGSTGATTGNHGLVRGRAHVARGTLVADDGSILRAVSTHTSADNYASRHYSDVNWWRALHDVGHFNAVRAAAYLGNWFGHGNVMDLPTIERVLDTIVANAGQTGMYVIIDDHSGESFTTPTDWKLNAQFWSAIAPRYKDKANVIYEIKNEPEVGGNWRALPGHEDSVFQLIRSLAPDTPIIAWSLESVTAVDDQYGLLKLLSQGTQINYSNAAVGYHPYEAIGQQQRLANLASQMQQARYPIVMTEYSNDRTPPLSYLYSLESAGISWFLLDGDGFTDAATGVTYGNPGNPPNPLHITWPED
jgi:Cellulase (glycosyl hydrolase family 5)